VLPVRRVRFHRIESDQRFMDMLALGALEGAQIISARGRGRARLMRVEHFGHFGRSMAVSEGLSNGDDWESGM
jgi:hypothetical protein